METVILTVETHPTAGVELGKMGIQKVSQEGSFPLLHARTARADGFSSGGDGDGFPALGFYQQLRFVAGYGVWFFSFVTGATAEPMVHSHRTRGRRAGIDAEKLYIWTAVVRIRHALAECEEGKQHRRA
ncbi:hypothetical protein ACLOJK_033969 [Asimina triloba]